VLSLAERLQVSRSGFYWHFGSRGELLSLLLERWRATSTAAIVETAARPASSILSAVLDLFAVFADPHRFDPALDFAVRGWARREEKVRAVLAAADAERLSAIGGLYRRHGFPDEEALVRARTLYMALLGFYVLGIDEPVKTRMSHLSAYLRSFTGVEPEPAERAAFRALVLTRRGAA